MLLAEEDPKQDHEGREDPDDKDPLVENIVKCEPHVRHQLLHAAHVLFHCQLKQGMMELNTDNKYVANTISQQARIHNLFKYLSNPKFSQINQPQHV